MTIKICRSVVGLGRVKLIQSITSASVIDSSPQEELEPDYVALDGSALENLEVGFKFFWRRHFR